jgi:c-di-GMP-binding flagellar brake protein YcgR
MLEQSSSASDRRVAFRCDVALPWNASIAHEGNNFSAELIDLSEGGAKFRSSDFSFESGIQKGHTVDWSVDLPSGKKTRFRAEVRWLHRFPEGHIIGVRFLDAVSAVLLKELNQVETPPA